MFVEGTLPETMKRGSTMLDHAGSYWCYELCCMPFGIFDRYFLKIRPPYILAAEGTSVSAFLVGSKWNLLSEA